jgi:hypothetical protein
MNREELLAIGIISDPRDLPPEDVQALLRVLEMFPGTVIDVGPELRARGV